jgi:hypothetical protein
MITMCPRGDLNTQVREISPNQGNHEVSIAGRCPRAGHSRLLAWRSPYADQIALPVPTGPLLPHIGRALHRRAFR